MAPVVTIAYAVPHLLRILRRVVLFNANLVEADYGEALVANRVGLSAIPGVVQADGCVGLAREKVMAKGTVGEEGVVDMGEGDCDES